jgi:hypothetical protein
MEKLGLDWLKKEAMEDVPLDEISKKDIQWCAGKWHLIMGLTLAGQLTEEVFKDKECYYGNLMVELEERIKALGGKVVPMKSVEIPNILSRFFRRTFRSYSL